jgi:hypothetical protein
MGLASATLAGVTVLAALVSEVFVESVPRRHCVEPRKTQNRRKSSSRCGNSLNLHRHLEPAIYPHSLAERLAWLFGFAEG